MDLSLDFPFSAVGAVCPEPSPIRCSAGYLIYLQNTEATCFYYLKSGRVKAISSPPTGAGAGTEYLSRGQPVRRGVLL